LIEISNIVAKIFEHSKISGPCLLHSASTWNFFFGGGRKLLSFKIYYYFLLWRYL